MATFRPSTRKPWAIDRACFAPCARPLYLTDMAVAPAGAGDFYARCGFVEVARASYRGVPLRYFADGLD